MTGETSTGREAASGGPYGNAQRPTGPGAHLTDTPPSPGLSGRDSRCGSRIAHEDGAVRQCLVEHVDPDPEIHAAGDAHWTNDDDRVIHDPERDSVTWAEAASLATAVMAEQEARRAALADREAALADQSDDLDRFTAEQMRDPEFVRAWVAAQAREVQAAYQRGYDRAREQLERRSFMLAKEGKDAYERGARNTAAKVALEIRRELVCCDVYEQLAPTRLLTEAAHDGCAELATLLDAQIGEHGICYWGEASARIAESVGRGDRDNNDATGGTT